MNSNPNYDSEFCGTVPIHLINTVQPYGALVVIARDTLNLIQISENAAVIFGLPTLSLLQTTMEDHLDPSSLTFLHQISSGRISDKVSLVWTIKEKKYLALIHIKERYILAEIEIEPFKEEDQRTFVSVYQDIKYSMSLINAASTTADVCTVAARELRRISGFDKVMIYRFDEEWNGTVIAEDKEATMESYFGFTFPASDIPRQARDLYLRNPYRFIPDRNYQPVRLYPVINPSTQSFIDLSDCNVRGVVAVHLEYLANMGVMASMSTRILSNDRLWGLIACHHKTATTISFQLCSVFELLSNVISARMLSLQNKERHDRQTRTGEIYARIIEQVYSTNNIYRGLLDGEVDILTLFEAGGAALTRGYEMTTKGSLPGKDSLEELLLWLQARRLTRILHSDHLAGNFDHAPSFADTASGLLAIPFNTEKEEYLLLFRPEVEKLINWGGDPGGRIVFEKDDHNYHPRNSFKRYQQIVRGTSLPWKEEELATAETLKSFLYEYSNK